MTKEAFSFFASYFLLIAVVGATDSLAVPKMHPTAVTVYDTDRGLPFSCISGGFIDREGRLWLNPCHSVDLYREQNFYRYDGNKSWAVSLETPGNQQRNQGLYLRGITGNGLLFGVSSDTAHCFLFDPATHENSFFAFAKSEKVRNMVAGDGAEAFVLTEDSGAYKLYQIAPNDKRFLVRIRPAAPSLGFSDQFLPLARSKDAIWFLHGTQGFYRYSLSDHSVRFFDWLAVAGGALKDYPVYDPTATTITFTIGWNGKPLFYIRKLNGYFEFDVNSGKLVRHAGLQKQLERIPQNNTYWQMIWFSCDARNNVIVCMHAQVRSGAGLQMKAAAFLIDSSGYMYDYTEVADAASAGKYATGAGDVFVSNNFKKNAFLPTNGGLVVVEIKADLTIDTPLIHWAVRGMAEIAKGKVLVVQEGGSRSIIDLHTMVVHDVPKGSPYEAFYSIPTMAQLASSGKNLWMPLSEGRLAAFQLDSETIRYYKIGREFEKFNFLGPGRIALVTLENEVYFYDLDQRRLYPFEYKGKTLNLGGLPTEVHPGKDGTLWIGTMNGLWHIDPESGAIKRLGKPEGFLDDQILCIHEADDGKLWLGTLKAGVHIYDPATGMVKVVDKSVGLSNNSVAGILADGKGILWVSTFDGITTVSPEGEVLFKFSEEEGLSHKEFNRFSSLKTADGRLLFGGVSGVNVLQPEAIKNRFTQEGNIRIFLTEIRYYDKSRQKEVPVSARFEALQRITLPATHRYIKLDFGLSDYINPDKCTYTYCLVRGTAEPGEFPEEATWLSLGSNSELALNDLPAGDYTILITGANAKGQEVGRPIAVPIRVQEFFYKTWWFYVLCSLPFLLGGFFWVRHLITERERLEKEVALRTGEIRKDKELIERQAAELKELDELKSSFFTNISHEFRTPLTVISGMTDHLIETHGKLLEKEGNLIKRNSQVLLNLINQILDLRKLESGKLQLQLVQGDVLPFLQYITESFSSLANDKKVKLGFKTDLRELVMDHDPEKLRQIMSNLLSNAVKFTPKGGEILVTAEEETAGQQRFLVLQVKDTGPGIAAEDLPQLFDLFYQARHNDLHKAFGTGVGLALVRELTRLLHGEVSVASRPDEGSVFTVKLPITRNAAPVASDALPEWQPGQAPEQAVAPVAVPLTQEAALPALLIVEDNDDIVRYLLSCLGAQFRITVAHDGQEGIERAFDSPPDIVLSDVMMPRKDGLELCQSLKEDERTSHIPVVLLTAKADVDSRIAGLRRGADAYLAKPFNREELLVCLQQLIALRRRLQERYRNLDEPEVAQDPALQQEDAFMKKLKAIVLQQLDDPAFGPPELGRALGMGRTNLYAKVKALTDRTPALFIRSLRLREARTLLAQQDLNISEVAYAVGFDDPAYFSRCFSDEFGLSPTVYRINP